VVEIVSDFDAGVLLLKPIRRLIDGGLTLRMADVEGSDWPKATGAVADTIPARDMEVIIILVTKLVTRRALARSDRPD
jgi:hypothetical protein